MEELEREYTIQSHFITLEPGEEDSWAEEEELSSDPVGKVQSFAMKCVIGCHIICQHHSIMMMIA